jgi:glycine/D-amino acid oxidase-like deaminating enzyme
LTDPEVNRRIDRRQFLQLLAAAALAREARAAARRRVVVAGAGIIGASIAYHLAEAGAEVTVIDRAGPATHASRASFAWINATWSKQPRAYHALNQSGVARWKLLQPRLRLPVRWSGSLEGISGTGEANEFGARVAEQVAWGENTRFLSRADLAELEPNVDFSTLSQAIYSANDGATDPVASTKAFLAAATALGARVHYPCELTGVSLAGNRLTSVQTSCGDIEADRLVLATGAAAGAAKRFADWEVPLRDAPGMTAITAPMPPLIQRVLWMPGVHMHQRDDGRIVLGEEDGPPPGEAHAARLAGHPNDFPAREIALQHAERMRAAAQRYLPDFTAVTFENAYVCWRPMSLDGFPVLGASPTRPDVYIAVTHSGVTLAPVIGQQVAGEIIEGATVAALATFRPDRRFEPSVGH